MSKVMGIYVNFGIFTMPTPQIWPCHVNQEANSGKSILFLILHLIFGKVTKFLVEKLSTSEVISQKTSPVVANTPSAFRVTSDVVLPAGDQGGEDVQIRTRSGRVVSTVDRLDC